MCKFNKRHSRSLPLTEKHKTLSREIKIDLNKEETYQIHGLKDITRLLLSPQKSIYNSI